MASDKILSPRRFSFPGIPATAAGSEAVVWVETHITQGACAYPITPSTNMGGGYQSAVANGQKNLWGEPLAFLELESEHSSASTCEGFARGGRARGELHFGPGFDPDERSPLRHRWQAAAGGVSHRRAPARHGET